MILLVRDLQGNVSMRYRIDELGWQQFEYLCQAILKRKFGDSIESWGGSRDRGRDAYCNRPIELSKGVLSGSPIVIQVKFISNANSLGAKWQSPLLSSVRSECSFLTANTVQRRTGQIAEYILVTNCSLSPEIREQIVAILQDSLPCSNVTLFGGNDICGWLDDLPNLRWAYPQLVSLRDMQALLEDRRKYSLNKVIFERSSIQMQLAREQSAAFVPTQTYRRALRVLNEHKFLVLSGAPEVGKTTLARALGLNAYFLGWEVYEVHDTHEMLQIIHRNAKAVGDTEMAVPRQLFIADDAFGTTEFDENFARDWSKDLHKVIAALDSNHFMIWTSRSAPLSHALDHLRLQEPAEYFPEPAKVIVNAADLSMEEKALMLYRHAKCALSDDAGKAFLRLHAFAIVSNEHFTPERIRRFVRTDLAELSGGASNVEIEVAIARQLRDPTRSMRQSFNSLSAFRQHFLVGLLDCPSRAIPTKVAYEAVVRIFGDVVDLEPREVALDLEEQFIKAVRPYGELNPNHIVFEWVHPSWRDLVIEHLAAHRLQRQRFLEKSSFYGIALALSTAGGSLGERVFPLLIELNDWMSLTNNIQAIIASANSSQVEKLLVILAGAQKYHTEKYQQEILSLVTASVSKLETSWLKERRLSTIVSLQMYCLLCHRAAIAVNNSVLEMNWHTSKAELAEFVFEGGDFDHLSETLHFLAALLQLILDNCQALVSRLRSGEEGELGFFDFAFSRLIDELVDEFAYSGDEPDSFDWWAERLSLCLLDLQVLSAVAVDSKVKISELEGKLYFYLSKSRRNQQKFKSRAESDDLFRTESEYCEESEPIADSNKEKVFNSQGGLLTSEQFIDELFADL